jgi:hypothetical protein
MTPFNCRFIVRISHSAGCPIFVAKRLRWAIAQKRYPLQNVWVPHPSRSEGWEGPAFSLTANQSNRIVEAFRIKPLQTVPLTSLPAGDIALNPVCTESSSEHEKGRHPVIRTCVYPFSSRILLAFAGRTHPIRPRHPTTRTSPATNFLELSFIPRDHPVAQT